MRKHTIFILFLLAISLAACGDTEANVVPTESEKIIFETSSVKGEMESRQEEPEISTEIIDEIKETTECETQNEVKSEEISFTVATEPITVPDPTTQSEFVVEVTAENFLSIFEFIAIPQYNAWGEYSYQLGGFSSLLYEQGWAIGTLKDFAVEYDVYDYSRVTDLGVTAGKTHFQVEEDAEVGLRIYRAKGILTCYPIESVKDTFYQDGDSRFFKRTLPDGLEVWIYTDKEGIMVY